NLARRPQHDPATGQFVRHNTRAGTTFARANGFWTAIEPAKRELLDRVREAAGGTDHAGETLLGLQDAYCEARLFRVSMFLRLVDSGGPITGKGKTRALYRAYLEALDREVKLAQVIGLTRRPRPVTPSEAMMQQPALQ